MPLSDYLKYIEEVFEETAVADNGEALTMLVATGKINTHCVIKTMDAVINGDENPAIFQHLLTIYDSLASSDDSSMGLNKLSEKAAKRGHSKIVELLLAHSAKRIKTPSSGLENILPEAVRSSTYDSSPSIVDKHTKFFKSQSVSNQKKLSIEEEREVLSI